MTLSVTRAGDIAIVTIDNPPVNALSRALRQDLLSAAASLDADTAVRAVVLCCAGRTFVAGADVSEFGRPPEPPHLPDVIARIETAAKPWIAAIHGTALGGGLELALGCRFRVAVPGAQLGLPEVTLGVLPGAGGTARLPRLIGMEDAARMITGGKPVPAEKARALGLIDSLAEGDLVTAACCYATKVLTQPLPPVLSERVLQPADAAFWPALEADLRKSARGAEAPLRALAVLRAGETLPFAAAMAQERTAFLELRASDQAAALRHVFFAERAAPRPAELKGIAPRPIAVAGVVGGGTMGAGIAAALRDAGLPVVLIERDDAAAARGLANLRAIYQGAVKRGRMTEAALAERLAGVTASTDYAALADADLVIEAVFEDLEVKRAVFAELARHCRGDAVLATNTSYLDPEAIAAGLPGPGRFLGLHFFSPAHVMKLLEIVPGRDTAPDVLATGFALAQRLGKIPVRAGICDGFIGNRMLKTTRAQAERLLLAGASPAQVDAAMRGFGLPMGPFEAQDLGGLDIAAFQRQAARARGETPFAPVADRLCALNRLGQKTGGGWYDYAAGDRRPRSSPQVEALLRDIAGAPRQALTDAEIVEAILLPMIDEGVTILQEGIALRPADVDLVQVHGYGFPRWRGGPLHMAERQGWRAVLARLAALADRGLAPPPGAALRAMAADEAPTDS
ncbi:3-hydroxyacyl-CoA dehydrogenase NAD-binding domain-containing protein [Plastorhodobacter daqingensis]|uniref:3-hydroxyacyl-CoA dehydrogenase NAD-binding domain-containing protein n=1 Tax=Plastorhodobacter daqingensis TaxID=1387281 RepID=A0ABW2UI09_9RHOB